MGFFGSLLNAAGAVVTGKWGDALSAFGQGVSNQEAASQQFKYQQELAAQQNAYNVDMFNKQSDFNAQQAELARQYQTAERQSSQAWEESMMDKQNEYNSPAAQMQRLMEAGFNPLSFDGNVSQSAGVNGVGSIPGSPASSNGLGAGLGSAPNVNPDNALVAAQVANLRASARKSDAEADVTESDAKYRDQINEGLLKLQDADVTLKISEKAKNDEEVKKLVASCENLVASTRLFNENIKKVQQETANLAEDFKSKSFEREYLRIRNAREEISRQLDPQYIISQINQNKSMAEFYKHNSAMLDEQAKYMCNMAKQALAQTGLISLQKAYIPRQYDSQFRFQQLSSDMLALQLGSFKDFNTADHYVNYFSQIGNTIAHGVGSIGVFLGGLGSITSVLGSSVNYAPQSMYNPL